MNGKTPHEQALAIDGGHRAQIIQGLIDAAHWLEAHPGIPVPGSITIQYSARSRDDVDRIAAAAGTGAGGHGGFYETRRHFGPAVDYEAVHVSSDVMAAWDGAMQVFRGAQADTGAAA